jgi:hypothetical protein
LPLGFQHAIATPISRTALPTRRRAAERRGCIAEGLLSRFSAGASDAAVQPISHWHAHCVGAICRLPNQALLSKPPIGQSNNLRRLVHPVGDVEEIGTINPARLQTF